MSEPIATGAAAQKLITDSETHANAGKYYRTIFVACGGTGAKVYERIRRQTIEKFGSLDDLPGVAYLSIDTDVGSKTAGHQQDGETGKAVNQLTDYTLTERVDLDGAKIGPFIENQTALANNPLIAAWFDPKLVDTTKGMKISKGAGQIRPVARLVAWANRQEIVSAFLVAWGKVTKMTEETGKRVITDKPVRVVICGSVAGGTGGGIFLDVAAMIRDACPDKGVSITGYFVLPNVFASVANNAKPKANGYACLTELNYYSTEPYKVKWTKMGPEVKIDVLYDKVYLFDSNNESGQSITGPGDIYDVIGDGMFLDFFQGKFAFGRDSVQSNRASTLARKLAVTATLKPKEWPAVQEHCSAPTPEVVSDSFRQSILSTGLSRVAVPSWRLLNQMSYSLASRMIGFLDNQEPLNADVQKLKQEFASKLNIYQGEVTVDGIKQSTFKVLNALNVYPSDGNAQATLEEAINGRFSDLTQPDAVRAMWGNRTCAADLNRLWDVVGKDFTGAQLPFDGYPGVYIKRITDNRRALMQGIAAGLLDKVIEEFCESPEVGPHRIAQVMDALCVDIIQAEVFWVKEMEKRAEEQGQLSETANIEWKKWQKLASAADGRLAVPAFADFGKGAFEEQIAQVQTAAQAYWNAIALKRVYIEAAGFLREVANYIRTNGIAPQNMLSARLKGIKDTFDVFSAEYARPRRSPVFTEYDNGTGLANFETTYLGDTEGRKRESLARLFKNVKEHIGLNTNRELRDFVSTKREEFIQQFRHSCWLALRGEGENERTTTWFSDAEIKGFLDKNSIYDYLLKQAESATSPKIAAIAGESFQKALPWIQMSDYAVDGIIKDCYVVLPPTNVNNKDIAETFYKGVMDAATGKNINVMRVTGSDPSEILICVEAAGLIPASIASLWGAAGTKATYEALAATRKNGDVESFLHLDRDIARYPQILPLTTEQARQTAKTWRSFLLGVMLGVIKTQPNTLRTDPTERVTAPFFAYTFTRNGATEIALGQWQDAIKVLTQDSTALSALDLMIAKEYVAMAAGRYERLLALVRYYKYCIFPRKAATGTDGGQSTEGVSMAYAVLNNLEGEVLNAWTTSTNESRITYAALMNPAGRVDELFWGMEAWAAHSGLNDDGAGIVESNWQLEEYLEAPGWAPDGNVALATERRALLKTRAFKLLPAHLRGDPALAGHVNLYPWLRLAPRYNIYFPSLNGGVAPDHQDPDHLTKLEELSVQEAATKLFSQPTDSNEKSGARVWTVNPIGNYEIWSTAIPRLKELYLKMRGVIDTSEKPLGGIAPPVTNGAGGKGLPPPPSDPQLVYFGPSTSAPVEATVANIVSYIQANPSGNHQVHVNGSWVPAQTVPEVAKALAPPSDVRQGLPLPPPPPRALPPPPVSAPPVSLPPIPAGPFQYYGAAFTDWTELSGEKVVQCVLTLAIGAEGYVAVDGAPVPVMSVAELAAAITARRK